MPTAIKHPAPVTVNFADDGTIPNNPTLALVLYRNGIDLAGTPDPERLIEKTFAANGWGDMWRNGIYPYVHYHSMIHEALGVARGRAKVRFGGDNGREIEIAPGDVAILPAGTGHQCLSQSAGPRGHRRLSAERQIRPLPRQQGRARAGARLDPESAAARDRSGVWAEGAAGRAVAPMTFWRP